MDRIKHFSHPHWLIMSEIEDDEEINCFICDQPCPKKCYGCKICLFFLHKACADLPEELNHPLHPPHTLSLCDMSDYVGRIYCDACDRRVSGRFTFRCRMCDFDLDIECAKKPKDEKARIRHFSHDHELILKEVIDESKQVWCYACEKRCFIDTYACSLCDFFLHKACAELKSETEHPLHEHVLKLCTTDTVYEDGKVWCDLCGKNFHGLVFHCKDCHFDLDLICAQTMPLVETADQVQMSHFGHKHPLKLIEKDETVTCRACGERCSGETFGCEQCEYFLHNACAELPEDMEHFYHKHPLKLQVAMYNYCDLCRKRIHGYTYRCHPCDFDLDVICARKPFVTTEGEKVTDKKKVEDIKLAHFSHQHELRGCIKREEDRLLCQACEKQCSGLTFSCGTCNIFLHEACATLPPKLDHFFHPSHKLILQNSNSGAFCGACEKKCSGFTFSCNKCAFHMDITCAMMVNKLRRGKYIGHISHGHPLKLIDKKLNSTCLACNKKRSGSDPVYGCNKCNVWLHEECVHLEVKVKHFFHKNCLETLTLVAPQANNVRRCKACHSRCQGIIYHCMQCKFTLDVECALLPSRASTVHSVVFFPGHGHPLQKQDIEEGKEVHLCSVCGVPCVHSSYQCILCAKYMVHEDCTTLERVIKRPLLHNHDIHLSSEQKSRFTCRACLKTSSVFSYDCHTCPSPFSLHTGCANIRPIIRYDAHKHRLCFFESTHGKLKCKSCLKEIEKQDELFHCVMCDFSLHLLCGPLPHNIKSQNHKHVLQLMDKFVEDDSGEYYCDACEGERDPEGCVYKCAEAKCPYVAHFKCMKPEVICLLKGEQKDVELKSLRGQISGRVVSEGLELTDPAKLDVGTDDREIEIQETMSLYSLLDAFIEEDKMKFPGAFQSLTNEMYGMENSEISMIFFRNENLVEVNSYMVLESLSPVLEQLLKKGDISLKSQLDPKTKSLIFNVLCGVIRSMSSVQLDESHETLLHNWWNQVKMAEHAGFEVRSALDKLVEVRRVHFDLRTKEVQRNRLKELDDQIKEWYESLEEMAAKAEDLTHKCREYIVSAKSSSVDEFLSKGKD